MNRVYITPGTSRIKSVNGYHVLAQGPMRSKLGDAHKGTVVLCFRDDYTFDNFVTWLVWNHGEGQFDVMHGRYIASLTDALTDFNDRSFGEVV